MRKIVIGALALAALAGPMAAAPAQAGHTLTLCNNERSDIWVAPVGADLQTPGEAYFCVDHLLVVFRTRGSVTFCSYYTANGTSSDDRCEVVQSP